MKVLLTQNEILMNSNKHHLEQLRQRFINSYLANDNFSLTEWSEHTNLNTLKFFQQVFTKGMCVNFQQGALAHLPDWKEYLFHYGESEYEYGQHVALKHPTENLFFDVFGLRSIDDILATYGAQNANYIWHEENELCSSYSVDEGVMEDIALFFIELFKVKEYKPNKEKQTCLHENLVSSLVSNNI